MESNMCGIAGFYGFKNDDLLKTMTRILSHRGADHEGLYTDGNLSLGHRRLAIIDLSSQAHQPMASTDNQAVITYNGEIYNFREIRDELNQEGYRFASKSDTEVILNAYLAWGPDCLHRFNGMFSFALWDKKKQKIFMARDRMGIKPLYYLHTGKAFLFASEIKSILCWSHYRREVNPRALDYFFTFRYNHLEETVFKGINKLPPGHYMEINQGDAGRIQISKKQYWEVEQGAAPLSRSETKKRIAEILEASVKHRKAGDVPVGAFLSGGIDSNAVVGMMGGEPNSRTSTFTVGFDGDGKHNELYQSRASSKYFDTTHSECICRPPDLSRLRKVIWHADDLNADPTLIPTYAVSELAAKKVKAVMTGEGGDELYGGYERINYLLHIRNMNNVSPLLSNALPSILGIVPSRAMDTVFKYSSSLGKSGLNRLSIICKNIKNTGLSYRAVAGIFDEGEQAQMYKSRLKTGENIAQSLNDEYFDGPINSEEDLYRKLAYFELKTRLPNGLLAKVDSMSMAHTLEARVPHLDHNLVQLAMSIPYSQKKSLIKDKVIFRQSVRNYVPRSVYNRKKDHFFTPIHHWIQDSEKSSIEALMTKDRIEQTGFLNADYVLKAYRCAKEGSLYHARQIWNIMTFLIWHELFIETDEFMSEGNGITSLAEHEGG